MILIHYLLFDFLLLLFCIPLNDNFFNIKIELKFSLNNVNPSSLILFPLNSNISKLMILLKPSLIHFNPSFPISLSLNYIDYTI